MSLLCLDKFCPDRLTFAGIQLSQSDIFVGNLLMNPVLGFSAVFNRPKQLVFQNFEGSGVYWWWNYYPELDNPIGFCIGLVYCEEAIVSYFKSLNKKEFKYENDLSHKV